MSLDQLKSDCKLKLFKKIYMICGEENYLKRFYKNELVGAIFETEDMLCDCITVSGKDVEAREISDFLESFSMFSPKRLMILKDMPLNSAACDFILKHKDDLNTDNIILIYNPSEQLDQRLKAFKELKAIIEENGVYCEIPKIDKATLRKWVAKQFILKKKTVSGDTIEYLLSQTDNDMDTLFCEIQKLISFCDGEITRDAIDTITTKTNEAKTYELTDAILNKDPEAAFSIIETLLKMRTQEAIILASIYSAVCNLYKLSLLSASGLTVAEAIKASGMRDFVANRYLARLKNIDRKNIEKALDLCASADVASKTTSSDDAATITVLTAELMRIL